MTETNGKMHGVDEHFLQKYRQLLDAEDAAFDELEHAYEDGDREHMATDFAAWKAAVERRTNYLERAGIISEPVLS